MSSLSTWLSGEPHAQPWWCELGAVPARLRACRVSKPSASWSGWALFSGFALVRGSGSEQAGQPVGPWPHSSPAASLGSGDNLWGGTAASAGNGAIARFFPLQRGDARGLAGAGSCRRGHADVMRVKDLVNSPPDKKSCREPEGLGTKELRVLEEIALLELLPCVWAVQPPSRWEDAVCAGGGNTKLGPWLEERAAHLHPPLLRWGCSRTWTQFGEAPSGMLHASLEGSWSREEGCWRCGRGPVSLNPPLC